jgi:RNA polymerase sigma-B factor
LLSSGTPTARAERVVEEHRLFARFRREGDPGAREAIVERFLPLASHLARRYDGRDVPLEDLVQVASLALLKAIDRFDPDRGIAFSSFAVPTIVGELKRHFRDKGWWIRVPRDLQELAMRVERASDLLFDELQRTPTPLEIAEHLGITVEEMLEAREAAGAYRADSLDRPCSDDDPDGRAMVDTLGGEDRGYRRAEQAVTIERLMETLSPREREIVTLRFVQDLTQAEIGARVGVSQMQVSRLLRQALERMRAVARQAEQACSAERE